MVSPSFNKTTLPLFKIKSVISTYRPKRRTDLELREHQRFPVQMNILLGPPNGPAEEGIALNLSLGGVRDKATEAHC